MSPHPPFSIGILEGDCLTKTEHFWHLHISLPQWRDGTW